MSDFTKQAEDATIFLLMNKTNFNQAGGFPLTAERLQELQTSFDSFNSFGELAGNLTIISGCETVGTTVKAGRVYINGEIYDFREASGVDANSQVIIIEENVDRAFENGTVKTVHVIRYATIGTAETSWPWSSFVRPIQTKEIPTNLVSQLAVIPGKAETSTVDALAVRVAALEALSIPQIKIVHDRQTVSAWTSLGDYSSDFTKNFIDIFPPSGYTMSHFKGIVPSIGQIRFNGDVDDNDTIWCNWQQRVDRIRVICGNREQQGAAIVNYLAIWIK